MTNSDNIIVFFWLLCHEEAYAFQNHFHVMLSNGRLLMLGQKKDVISELLPPEPFEVPGLPTLDLVLDKELRVTRGIVVDPRIALKLRNFTCLLLRKDQGK